MAVSALTKEEKHLLDSLQYRLQQLEATVKELERFCPRTLHADEKENPNG